MMRWRQLFTPVKAVEPEEAKALIAQWVEGSYTLLDVRQPGVLMGVGPDELIDIH